MKVIELVQALIDSSEKGANIARAIRSESALLELLVQEKKGDQKNSRFVQDFKTLADVLVQEMMRHDLSQKFPGIEENIFGEESNKFTNVLGEMVTVQIKSSQSETSSLLCTVLDGNQQAAELLASVVHETIATDTGPELQNLQSLEIDIKDIGVWIDPIDSTAQYIDGLCSEVSSHGMVENGLQCVAVLVGVYHQQTGLPLIGVTNRPFCKLVDSRWIGECMWGVSINDTKVTSLGEEISKQGQNQANFSALMSRSEKSEIQELFKLQMTVNYASGAGYKLLGVIQCHSNVYLLSKGSTFKWDTCGPHAILLSLGGGIVSLQDLARMSEFKSEEILNCQIKYNKSDGPDLSGANKWCNSGGIVAYRTLNDLLNVFKVYNSLK